MTNNLPGTDYPKNLKNNLPGTDYAKKASPLMPVKKAAPLTQPPAKKAPFGPDILPSNVSKVNAATSAKLQKVSRLPGRLGSPKKAQAGRGR
jgi:hypothetical protein